MNRVLLACVLVVAACSAQSTSMPPGPTQAVIALPGQSAQPGLVGCVGGLEYDPPFRLHGDPAGDPPVWAGRDDAERVEIVWPVGFYATFGPNLHVHSADGSIRANEGDIIDQQAWPGLLACASHFYVHVYWLSELET